MGLPPGEYDDGEGHRRYFDGNSYFGNKVRGPDGSWVDGPPPKTVGPGWNARQVYSLGGPPLGAEQPKPTTPDYYSSPVSPSVSSALTTMGAIAFLCAIVVLIVSQFVEANRWAMLVAWIVLTVATPVVWLFRGRRGGRLTIVLAALWLVNGCGAMWGFSLAKEDPPPSEPDAVALAREAVADEVTGFGSTLCHYLEKDAARRLRERYDATTCRNALKQAREEADDAERIRRSLAVTPVSVEEDVSTPQDDRKIRVKLGKNPLELRWLAFTVRYVDSRDRWEKVQIDGAG